jgi:hypothetical protein
VYIAQEQDDVASVQTMNDEAPAAEADVPDIYWWKSLLTDEQLANYLTAPAQAAAGATDPVAAAVPTPAAIPAGDSVPSNGVSEAAGATGPDASASASDAASATGVSAAATDGKSYPLYMKA